MLLLFLKIMEDLNKNKSYHWYLKNSTFKKDKGTVFSCFSGGGGSSMGYTLAGFNVIGCNDIDKDLMKCYITNLNPKYSYLQSIRKFRKRNDLPDELYNLDILDGSPPCSSFTNAGKRSKDWGKKKKFREGQINQVLDTLFFDFILLAKKLQPKIVIAENVPGITFGNAIKYTQKIYKEFDKAGYYINHWLLDSSKMGVPQKRKRIFFIALRKDLIVHFNTQIKLFNKLPILNLDFNEKPIKAKEILDQIDDNFIKLSPLFKKYWKETKIGKYVGKFQSGFLKVNPNQVCPVINNGPYPLFHPFKERSLNKKEVLLIHSFPLDYNFLDQRTYWNIPVLSVPPLMMEKIANEIYKQWLIKIL